MASSTLRRLSSSLSKSYYFHPVLPSPSTVAGARLGTSLAKARLLTSGTGFYHHDRVRTIQATPMTTDVVSRRFASAAAAAAAEHQSEQREGSPKLDSSESSSTTRMTYKERLSGSNVQWIPAHWVTVIYKDLLGGSSSSTPTPDDALLLLNCFDGRLAEESPSNRVKMAEKAWQDLKAAGVALDVRHYNALLSVYLANEHAFDPEDFLLILSEDGVAMDDQSYSLFVRGYCQKGNVDDAMRTLEFMKSKGMKMTRPLFHALISGHIRAGDLEGAQRMEVLMKKAYSELETADFLPTILTHARMGNVEKLLDSFVDLKSNSLQLEVGDVLKATTAYLDFCAEENKYPESSALDSLYDTLKSARYMAGFSGAVSQTIVHTVRLGFNDVAADILRLFPQARFAMDQFFRNAVRTLPFTDVLRYCDDLGQAAGTDPLTEFCLPVIRKLPFDSLQQVLIDAKECGMPVETLSEIIESKLPATEGEDSGYLEYLMGSSTNRGSRMEQVMLLAIQLELPLANDDQFWEKRAFDSQMASFDRLFNRLLEIGSKHDAPLIEAVKPAMIRGFTNSVLKSQRLDRLKIVADLFKANPDYVFPERMSGYLASRLSYKGSPAVKVLPDALFLLERNGGLNGGGIGELLKRVCDRNPDPRVIAGIVEVANANEALPRMSLLDECLKGTESHPEAQKVLRDFVEGYRSDHLEYSILEKMTLQELTDYGEKIRRNLGIMLVKKMAEAGEEEQALDALPKLNGKGAQARALPSIVDMYVHTIGDGFKGLEYLDVLVRNYGDENGVTIATPTLLRLVEILVNNGRSLADLNIYEEIGVTKIKMTSPFGEHDRRVIMDHVAFISGLEEDQAVIDRYLSQLTQLNLGSYLVEAHLANVLKKSGVKEALEMVKSYFNDDEKKLPEAKSIPLEEDLLDAIVKTEDVGLLKEFLDLSFLVHGERNAFLHLAFALYKGNKYAQGRRILNIPGLRSEDGQVPRYCEKLLSEGRHEALENFCQDVCCLFGVDKSELSFYKLRSIMARGDKTAALEYFNQLLNENGPMNDDLKRQAASLYNDLGLDFHDKSIAAKDLNDRLVHPPSQDHFEGNMSEVLRNIRAGTEYPVEFYKQLVETVLAGDPSPVLDALVQRGDLAALEHLDVASTANVKSHIAFIYLRQNRLEELLKKCGADADVAIDYLTADNLQYVRTKRDADEWIDRIEDFAKVNNNTKMLETVFTLHLSMSRVERAQALLAGHPTIGSDGVMSLTHVNSYSTLLAVTQMDLAEKTRGRAFYRLIHTASLWKVSSLVVEAVDRLYAANIGFYISPALRSRVKAVVGKDLFTRDPGVMGVKAETEAEDRSMDASVDDILGEDSIESSIPDLDEVKSTV